MATNAGIILDLDWINRVNINPWLIHPRIKNILQKSSYLTGEHRIAWLLRAITCIDLTTLGGDDTVTNVSRLCRKARNPIPEDILEQFGFSSKDSFTTAAVCVYPAQVKNAYSTLSDLGFAQTIPVASVATGFPSGQYPLSTRLDEIKFSVQEGATEIDVVVDRSLVLSENWKLLFEELSQMKLACAHAHMKTILAVGELGSYTNVYKASLVAMMAGSDFIKTSTGKESVNATLPFGLVMMQAIKDYYRETGNKVGFKPAGGIRTCDDAINWLVLLKEILGNTWLNNNLFRFGASGLLGDIENEIYFYAKGIAPASYSFTVC